MGSQFLGSYPKDRIRDVQENVCAKIVSYISAVFLQWKMEDKLNKMIVEWLNTVYSYKERCSCKYSCFACMHAQSCPTLCYPMDHTPWTHQALLSMEFSRWEYWSGWPFPPPEYLSSPSLLHILLGRQILYHCVT